MRGWCGRTDGKTGVKENGVVRVGEDDGREIRPREAALSYRLLTGSRAGFRTVRSHWRPIWRGLLRSRCLRFVDD